MKIKSDFTRKTKTITAAAAAILTTVLLAVVFGKSRSDLGEILRQFGLVSGFHGFIIKQINENRIKDKLVVRLEGARESEHLRATIILGMDENEWKTYAKQRKFEIDNSYGRGELPYPGAVSQRIGCPAEFIPTIVLAKGEGWTGYLARTLANSRLQIGVCDAAEDSFHAAILLLYCSSQKKVFELQSFWPGGADDNVEILRRLACAEEGKGET